MATHDNHLGHCCCLYSRRTIHLPILLPTIYRCCNLLSNIHARTYCYTGHFPIRNILPNQKGNTNNVQTDNCKQCYNNHPNFYFNLQLWSKGCCDRKRNIVAHNAGRPLLLFFYTQGGLATVFSLAGKSFREIGLKTCF
ncbi:MAG: hypothetical protein UU06_C0007G0012 [Parcubacteria group bacterium GW2011_GWB1_40_5]|nr:MAG: hypothetical protein UU06_C0007G0012 [Parcubacteria group bacterium GW2011_GWB1_40_5]